MDGDYFDDRVTLTDLGEHRLRDLSSSVHVFQVAADLSAEFRHGAWLCELAPLTNPDAVWDVVAASLRVQMVPGRTMEEATLDYLAAKRLLLVLDNCEHLVGAVAGARTAAVPVLEVPGADTGAETIMAADAVLLFADRAPRPNTTSPLTSATPPR